MEARARGYGYSQITFNYENEGYYVKLDKITVAPSKLPDLIPQNLRTDPETFGPGDYVDILVDVSNIGDADAVSDWGSIAVQSYLYQNGELIKYGPSRNIDEIIGAGETKPVAVGTLLWPHDYEEYTIKVWVDRGMGYGSVYESNENNNNITTPKSAPYYTISNPSPANGATIYVSSEEESQDSTQVESTNIETSTFSTTESLDSPTTNSASASIASTPTQSIEDLSSAWQYSIDGTVASGGTAASTQQPSGLSVDSSSNGELLLSWSGAPDGYDMTYKIYFGVGSPSKLIGSVETACCLYSGSLTAGNTYYWKVIAEDEYGTTVEGPVWHFTVSDENNNSGSVSSGGTSNAEQQQTATV
ncbi:MAG: CARDB domain-containing protein [Candidatus Thermoplasmatota archaeon]|nr:CARDB domain-containing protein [Candidatus Thermoplasmatota archaeon]